MKDRDKRIHPWYYWKTKDKVYRLNKISSIYTIAVCATVYVVCDLIQLWF